MTEIISIFVSAVLIENIILSSFLGICPFLGVSKKTSNAIGMGAALTFVVLMSSILSYVINRFLLVPFGLEYLQLVVFILVIATFVQLVEFVTKKYMPALYKALGIYLPLITTNCVVLNVALTVTGMTNGVADYSFGTMLVYALSIPIGYVFVIVLFSFIRNRLDSNGVPAPFQGNAIALITAALMALAFAGFTGIV